MKWTVMIEGRDDLGEVQRAQLRIENGFERLKAGEFGLPIDDGKRIMTTLQGLVARRELAAYARARRVRPECACFRNVKDYTTRKNRTVFGRGATEMYGVGRKGRGKAATQRGRNGRGCPRERSDSRS